MCSHTLYSLRGVSPHSYFYSHFNTIPLFVERFYTNPFIDVQRVTLQSTMYIKAYFLNQSNTSKFFNSENNNENHDCKL